MKIQAQISFSLFLLAATSFLAVSCQKKGSNDAPVNQYVFTGSALDILSGSYNLPGRSTLNVNMNCSTGPIQFNTRTELCTVLTDETRNANCAGDQRQQMFQQYCVNANTSGVWGQNQGGQFNRNGNQNPGGLPQNQGPSTPGDIGVGNSKLVTCFVDREGHGGIFSTNSQNSVTKIWKITDADSINFSKSYFANSGTAKVLLIPKSGTEAAKMQIQFSKKSDSGKGDLVKSASVEASIDTVAYLVVADEEDQRQSTIQCSVTSGQAPAVAAGKTLNCEGSGQTASAHKFKIAKNYAWNGKNIYETIPLGKDEDETLILTANVGLSGQPSQISIKIPHADHDLDVEGVGTLSTSMTKFSTKEQTSDFKIELNCHLMP